MVYILSRLLHGVFVLLGVSVVVFGLTWLTGDPASVLLPLSTPPDQVEVFRHNMGLDQPIPVQYAAFLGRAVHGGLWRVVPPPYVGLAIGPGAPARDPAADGVRRCCSPSS